MPCPCCRCLFFLCHLLPSLPEGQVQRESCETHKNTQMLLRWEKTMVKLHVRAWSPVLERLTAQRQGHMLPRAQVRPLLGGRVGLGGPGFRPNKVESLFHESGWSCVGGLCELPKAVGCLTLSSVWNQASLSAGHRLDILSCRVSW